MTLRLLHLSDIHFQGYGMGWDEDRDQHDELLRDVERLVANSTPVDGILVGGDVAFSAEQEQYEDATKWLTRLFEACGCAPSNVWAIPGNHDVSWAAVRASRICNDFRGAVRGSSAHAIDVALHERLSQDPGSEALMKPLSEYNVFAEHWNCAVSAQSPSWNDRALSLDDLPVRLIGLNSALISDQNDSIDADEHKLVLGTYQCTFSRLDGVITVVLCHHPPTWLRDWETVEPFLQRAHLVLFGHEHQYSARQDVPRGSVYVLAGAVGPERLARPSTDEYAPTYNLLTLEKSTDEILVIVEPRVWLRNGTCFGAHPDGTQRFVVAIDLESAEEVPGDKEELDKEAETSLSSSPLVPDSPELKPEKLSDAAARERLELRDIGVRFMNKPVSRRLEIARHLGVFEEADLQMPGSEMFPTFLHRIRDLDLIDKLVEELERG